MWLPTKQVQMWAVLTDVTAEQRRNSPSGLLRTNLDYEDQFGVSQCTKGSLHVQRKARWWGSGAKSGQNKAGWPGVLSLGTDTSVFKYLKDEKIDFCGRENRFWPVQKLHESEACSIKNIFFFLVLNLLTNAKDSLVGQFTSYTEGSKVRWASRIFILELLTPPEASSSLMIKTEPLKMK